MTKKCRNVKTRKYESGVKDWGERFVARPEEKEWGEAELKAVDSRVG